MVELDWAVGEILKMLEDEGLSENTLVIFTSDNGPVYDDGYRDGTTVPTSSREVDRGHDASGPFRGGKYQIYEGGTRVPFIVKWPGHVRPGRSEALVTQIDFIASFAELLGIELKEGQAPDSRNALAALLGKKLRGRRYIIEESGRTFAVRRGSWKYVRKIRRKGKPVEELYNLDRDVGEKKNIAKERAGVTAELRRRLMEAARSKAGLRRLDQERSGP